MAKGARNKKGKTQAPEGIKLGKGFREALPAIAGNEEGTNEWKDDWSSKKQMTEEEADTSIDSKMQSYTADKEVMDEAAVFEKYGIGKSKTDRFGNEISAR